MNASDAVAPCTLLHAGLPPRPSFERKIDPTKQHAGCRAEIEDRRLVAPTLEGERTARVGCKRGARTVTRRLAAGYGSSAASHRTLERRPPAITSSIPHTGTLESGPMGLAHALRSWFEPPRHLIALFLLVTLLPSLALGGLGWKLFRDDRDNEARLARERRDQALDVVVSALERGLTASEQSLREATPSSLSADGDAVVVTFADGTATASPAGMLPYLPASAPLPEAPPELFAEGEDLEFRVGDSAPRRSLLRATARAESCRRDPGGSAHPARADYQGNGSARSRACVLWHSRSDDRRGGGRRTGRFAGALGSLRPARHDGSLSDLQNDARELLKDLQHGRWPVTQSVFELHVADAAGGDGCEADGALAPDTIARANAAQWLWTRWKQLPEGATFAGRSAQTFRDRLATLIWTGNSSRATALIVGSRFVDANGSQKPKALIARQALEIRLRDSSAG